MDDRQIPKWSELRELLQFRKLELDPVERRLAQAFTIADLREGARKTTPRAVFNYTDGCSGRGDHDRPLPPGFPGHRVRALGSSRRLEP